MEHVTTSGTGSQGASGVEGSAVSGAAGEIATTMPHSSPRQASDRQMPDNAAASAGSGAVPAPGHPADSDDGGANSAVESEKQSSVDNDLVERGQVASVAEMPVDASAAQDKKVPTGRGRGVSGLSIHDILKNKAVCKDGDDAQDDQSTVAAPEEPDPQAAGKIMAAREEFVAKLGRTRPRIATAMEMMVVDGNRISTTVSTELLREDILLHQKEITGLLREISGVTGPVEISVNVKEDNSAVRPIRPEDKLDHLRAKNPLLDEIRRELNLEME